MNDREHYTDLGNARRLVELHGADLRYCADRRSWYVWDGKRWEPDATGEAMRRAKETVRAMYREAGMMLDAASTIEDDDERKKAVALAESLKSFAVRSESRSRLEAMLKLAETELPIPITIDRLDADPWLLNAQNGTIDLRTGALRPHRREDLITRICPVGYDSAARDEPWSQFIQQVMPYEDVRRYVQKALGYSITGTNEEGGIFLPYGPTHTGKTTLLEAAKAALGSYAVAMDVETLTGDKRSRDGGRARPDLLRLFGSRLVISTEVPNGVRLDEALVKKLTGGDSNWWRGLYDSKGVEGKATFVIWLGSNYRPRVRNDDDAIWNRVWQIPFNEQHSGGSKDKALRPYLCSDARQAVLAWLIEGARLFHEEDLEAPEAITTLTQDYRREMNPLWPWVNEFCDIGPDHASTYGELRFSYDQYATPRERVGTRTFQNSLKEIDWVTFDSGIRKYRGIRVTPHEPDEQSRMDQTFQAMMIELADES